MPLALMRQESNRTRESGDKLLSEYGPKFVSNVSYALARRLLSAVVGGLITAYVIRKLGVERYGIVAVAAGAVSMLSLLQMGSSAGLARKLNASWTRCDPKGVTRYYSAGLLIAWVMAFAVLLGVVVLATAGWSLLRFPPAHASEGKLAFLALGISTSLNAAMMPVVACYQATHSIGAYERQGAVLIVARALATVIIFETVGASAFLYTVLLAGETVAQAAIAWSWKRRNLAEAAFRVDRTALNTVKEVFSFNLLVLFSSINHFLFMQSPVIILQARSGLGAAGGYGVALQLNNLIRGLLTPGMNALSPLASSLETKKAHREFRQLFRTANKVFISVSLLTWCGFHFLGQSLLSLWLKTVPDGLDAALSSLMAVAAVGVAAMPAAVYLVALERLRAAAVIGLTLAGLMVCCMITGSVFAAADALQATGLILLCTFGSYQLVRLVIASLGVGVSWRHAVEDIARAVSPTLAPACLMRLASGYGLCDGAWGLSAATIMSGVLFLVVLYRGTLDSTERLIISKLWRTLLSK